MTLDFNAHRDLSIAFNPRNTKYRVVDAEAGSAPG